MAENLTIESPDFDRVRKGDPHATEDAVKLLWYVLNNEIKTRRQNDRSIASRLSPGINTHAPSAAVNNFDVTGIGFLVYTGSTAVDVSGYRAGVDGDILVIHVTGSATITHLHQSASSDAQNRIVTADGTSTAVATSKTLTLIYQNARWREVIAA